MLASARLGDDPFLPHEPGEERLPGDVVGLVRASVEEVLPFHHHLEAAGFREGRSRRERRRPARPLLEKRRELPLELAARNDLPSSPLELFERGDEKLGNVAATVVPESADAGRERCRHCRFPSIRFEEPPELRLVLHSRLPLDAAREIDPVGTMLQQFCDVLGSNAAGDEGEGRSGAAEEAPVEAPPRATAADVEERGPSGRWLRRERWKPPGRLAQIVDSQNAKALGFDAPNVGVGGVVELDPVGAGSAGIRKHFLQGNVSKHQDSGRIRADSREEGARFVDAHATRGARRAHRADEVRSEGNRDLRVLDAFEPADLDERPHPRISRISAAGSSCLMRAPPTRTASATPRRPRTSSALW